MGGEESGGIGIPSHVFERDGLLSGLLLLEIMSEKKKRLGELLKDLVQEIGPFYFHREDLPLSKNDIERVREKIKETPLSPLSKIGSLKVKEVNRMDGLKYLFEDESWLLIRPSGTEPLVRLYAEASDPALVQKLIAEAKNLLQ
jgi:phosphomannomutase